MRSILIAFLLVSAWPGGASAQQRAHAGAEDLARALSAQFEAALVRERRLADDRELRQISAAEERLAEARRAADARVGAAEVALLEAREEFASLVSSIIDRDTAAQVDTQAYRAEALRLAAESTPERLAALRRFADGDRVGAWPLLDALRLVEDRAIESAANVRRARRWREDAALREIMRRQGEASIADVLSLWDEAARLDSTNYQTQIARAKLSEDLGDLTRARSAAEAALHAASNDGERADALRRLGQILARQGDVAAAREQFARARTLAQESYAARGSLDDAIRIIGSSFYFDYSGRQASFEAATPEERRAQMAINYERLITAFIAEPGADPQFAEHGFALAAAIRRDDRTAVIHAMQGMVDYSFATIGSAASGADRVEAVVTTLMLCEMFMHVSATDNARACRERLVPDWRAELDLQPRNRELLLAGIFAMNGLARATVNPTESVRNDENAVELARRLVALDATNADDLSLLATMLNDLAIDQVRAEQTERARVALQESVSLRQALLTRDPTNSNYRWSLARAQILSGEVEQTTDPASALRGYREALAHLRTLNESGAGRGVQFYSAASDCLFRIGLLVEPDEADGYLRDATDLARRLIEVAPATERGILLNPIWRRGEIGKLSWSDVVAELDQAGADNIESHWYPHLARALADASALAWSEEDYELAESSAARSLRIYRHLLEQRSEAVAPDALSFALQLNARALQRRGDTAGAISLLTEQYQLQVALAEADTRSLPRAMKVGEALANLARIGARPWPAVVRYYEELERRGFADASLDQALSYARGRALDQ